MKRFLFGPKHVTILICWLALAGCLGGPSGPTNFYMLSALSPSPDRTLAATAEGRIRIGLATVVVPEYLNRNEIVVNLDNTVYRLAEFNQWAEPLNDNLTRVLEENLTNLLRDDSIDVFLTTDSSIPTDYRLEVDVLRLDGNLGDQATLVAQWALLEAEQDELIQMQRSEYQEPAADNTYKELVLAKSRTIEKLSRDMAGAIKGALAKISTQ
ncbi:MAG: PqiC family protein [Desulfobacteraceae bacterium]|nr:PqiC family protein [Desulfobacteraceae bacterium]